MCHFSGHFPLLQSKYSAHVADEESKIDVHVFKNVANWNNLDMISSTHWKLSYASRAPICNSSVYKFLCRSVLWSNAPVSQSSWLVGDRRSVGWLVTHLHLPLFWGDFCIAALSNSRGQFYRVLIFFTWYWIWDSGNIATAKNVLLSVKWSTDHALMQLVEGAKTPPPPSILTPLGVQSYQGAWFVAELNTFNLMEAFFFNFLLVPEIWQEKGSWFTNFR